MFSASILKPNIAQFARVASMADYQASRAADISMPLNRYHFNECIVSVIQYEAICNVVGTMTVSDAIQQRSSLTLN